ncbi:hypothetical protein [Psychrobium sp. 1_MG-2023]|uniref:hypothetical protein n=1 Tax=Psychrobium sp. 1_MG-2023 TaxID=3062624 RepID=UPI000C3395B8|nr:hypothetical protein [Psychrobium sp. 1_MG-2023]MDP2561192.1 hypothetical protein [Psychrobium sp. 1_MG-2023]PKF55302.1 hypothetical protein CW748_13885 [Alteromonadales bacterium alter-6D02]
MIKLTALRLEALQDSWEDRVRSSFLIHTRGQAYREDIEACIFEDDIADIFLADVKEVYDTSDFYDFDMIDWIRELQHEAITDTPLIAVSLEEFIFDKYNDSQTEFAIAQGLKRQQVTKWLNESCVVIEDLLYCKRKELI